ncbi:patatin-like phospholipase family protein [Porphyromonas sp.]|uniref:patatin-like phospholipase family protein n=1 Tax=Porphyromonas sp. TaxID=1924944 RepID=UPI0026DCE3DF|nr:patatin-like phospholipase family protein [Porphyromonas sp.]MDO4771565.1 patatin-like phospholipase family protein [Porphyromonas sp.]
MNKKDYFFQNLIFEGGGVKGIAYVGALEVLREEGILDAIKRVAGTSAGAIVAVLLGIGYTPEEIKKIMWELDFKNFMDDSWGLVKDSCRLINEFGWYKGDFFRSWIAELIEQKLGNTEATFDDLRQSSDGLDTKEIYLIGTNLSTGFSEIFSHEHTPRFCIADAARISMSIPLFFAAKRNFRGDLYVDGGVLDNYPVKIFDRRKYVKTNWARTEYYQKINETLKDKPRKISDYVYNKQSLGFKLDSKEKISMFRDQAEPPKREIDNFWEYTCALLNTLIDAQDNAHLHCDDWQRTIYIDTLGVKATDFHIKDDMKEALLSSGRDYAKSYLDWYNNSDPKANK